MEYILALLPYFTIGIVAAFISRFTGIAISFLLVPTLLYWGGYAGRSRIIYVDIHFV